MTQERFYDPSAHEQFIANIISPSGVSSAIVDAFAAIDRAHFVPQEILEHSILKDLAYKDVVIPLGKYATISQPSLVAQMLELAKLSKDQTVLEIGTATGYQASILSKLVREVHSVEIDSSLYATAQQKISELAIKNIHLHFGDGAKGVPDQKFDRIIVTAGLKSIPPALIEQLNDGGIIVAPIGNHPQTCMLQITQKIGDEVAHIQRHPCSFVPLFSDQEGGWTLDDL